MDPVVHFETPYEDKNRAAEFYKEAFGWEAQMLGPEMGEYVVVHTTEMDEKNMPLEAGRINGGLFKKPEDEMSQHPSVVIAVKDIQASLQKITVAGGKVLGEPMEIPGIGLYAGFVDTEGNRVSVIQPIRM